MSLEKKLKKFGKNIDNNNIDELYDVCMCEGSWGRLYNKVYLMIPFMAGIVWIVYWIYRWVVLSGNGKVDETITEKTILHEIWRWETIAAVLIVHILIGIIWVIVMACIHLVIQKMYVKSNVKIKDMNTSEKIKKLKYIDDTLYLLNGKHEGSVFFGLTLLVVLLLDFVLPTGLYIVELVKMNRSFGYSFIEEVILMIGLLVIILLPYFYLLFMISAIPSLFVYFTDDMLKKFVEYAKKEEIKHEYGGCKLAERCERKMKNKESAGYLYVSGYKSNPYYQAQYNKYMNQFGGSSGSGTSGSGSSSMHDELDALHRSLYEHHPDDWSAPPPPWKDY